MSVDQEKGLAQVDELKKSKSVELEISSKAFSDASDEIDPVAEKRLVRKLDWLLLPLFTLIYGCNFVDRTAIGNARIAGLEKDLHMQGFDLNIALTVFYICFLASEIPSNLALKRFGSIWIAFLVIGFGAVAIGSAFITSYSELLVTRVFLGLAEGGTLSGLVYVLARYYRRNELVLRVGIFFGLSPSLAGAFGGLLASGLLTVSDIGTVTSWRKIFLIEGIITTGFGVILLFIIPGDPRTTRMLTEEERALAIARIDADQAVKTAGRKEPTTLKLVLRSFNIHTTACAICFMMINISFQGLSLFLPTVINTLGKFTTVNAQLRTVPPYLFGTVWAIANAYGAYRMKQRAIPIIASVMFMVLGYAISIGTKDPHARYAACFFSVAGGSPSGPMLVTWATDNAAPDTMRAVTTAIIPSIGALGSIIAVWTYLPKDAPNFHKGNSLNLATSLAVCAILALIAVYLRWENAKRDRGERDYRLEGKSVEEIEQLGYLHPNFRYQI
ncbi:MFS general substrate transporter [Crucibulum laeve]|uniref:MFS general substrate transporter n=1 Tax=Crucibulum laeve TaxID=68775 RepID=A0A5C3M548_9AGAR|nr:MFS general substrate transporter [Crucibulum laeve]